MNEPANGRIGVPGAGQPAETDRLLQGIEDDLESLDRLTSADQVPVYDRVHSTLAEALARTADTGASPSPGPVPGDTGA